MTTEPEEEPCALNIRNFPRDVLDACKKQAIDDKCTLREFVIGVLKEASAKNRKGGRKRRGEVSSEGGDEKT